MAKIGSLIKKQKDESEKRQSYFQKTYADRSDATRTGVTTGTGAMSSGTSLPTFNVSSKIGASAPQLQFEEATEVKKRDTTPTQIYEEATEVAPKKSGLLDQLKTELKSTVSGMNGLQDYEVKDEFTGITTKQLGRLSRDKITYSANNESTGAVSKLLKDGDTNSDTFLGQFKSNYGQGRLSQTQALAWNAYLDDPTEENRKAAEEIDTLLENYAKRNATALDDTNQKLSVVSKSLANYLPQFQDQIGATVKGGIAAGIASAGNPTAIKVGATAASGLQMYQTARGTAYRNLIEAGVDDKTARALAQDEGFVQGVIEAADTAFDLATLGTGKLIDLAAKGTFSKATSEAGKTAAGKVLRTLLGYAANVVGEGLQEGVQEGVTIANEQRGLNKDLSGKTGLTKDAAQVLWNAYTGTSDTDKANWSRIREASVEGAKIAAMMGGATVAANQITQRVAAGTNTSGAVDTSSKTTYNKPVETVSPAASSAVKQTAAQAENTQLQNPESDVLDAATTAWMSLGMNLKTAKQRAEITQKLIRGEEVSVREINKLDPTNKEAQKVFSELTGVQFPDTKMPIEQTYNLFRSASTVAQTAQMAQEAAQERSQMQAAERAKVETEIAQMGAEVAQAVQERAENAPVAQSEDAETTFLNADGAPLATLQEFTTEARAKQPDLSPAQISEGYNRYVASTATVEQDGKRLNLQEFAAALQQRTGAPVSTTEATEQFLATAQQQSGQKNVVGEPKVTQKSVTGDTLALDNGGEITREQFTAFVQDYYNTQGKPVTETQANVMFNQLQARAAQGQPMQYFPEMDRYMKEDKEDGRQVQASAEGNQEAGVRTPAPTDRRGREQDVGRGAEDSGRGVRRSAGSDTRGDRRDGSAGAGDDVARRGLDAGGRGESESHESGSQESGGRESGSSPLRRLRGERSAENTGGTGRDGASGRDSVRGLLEEDGPVTEAKDTRELLEQSLREAEESGQTQEQRAEAIRSSGLKSRSKLFRGLGGSLAVVDPRDYTPEMKRISAFVKRFTGAEVYFKIGALYDARHRSTYQGVYLPDDHAIVLRADHPTYGLAQVFGHEIFHCFSALDRQLPERIIQNMAARHNMNIEAINNVIRGHYETPAYVKAFGGPMNDENRRLYYEEFLGDLHGGLNFRLKWNTAKFEGVKSIVDDEIAKWEVEWAEKGQLNTVIENSDSSEGRVFPLSSEKLWEEQLEELNETSSQDALYIEETPNLLAEVGLGDLPLCMTKAHMRNALHERVEGNDHYHAVPYRVALELPELLSRPAMILKSRTQRGDIVVVTTAMDDQGDPVVVSIHPNGRATVDGTRGPANFITSMYGRNNFAPRSGRSSKNNMLYLALHDRSILYWNKDRMGQLARDCRFQIPLGISKVPAGTILGVHEGYRKSQIPQRMFSFDDGSDNEEYAPGSLFGKVFGESKAPRVGGAIDPSNAKRRGNRFFDKETGEELYLSNDLSMYGGLLYRDEVGDYLDIPKDYEDVDADLDPGDLLDFTEGTTDLYADDEGLIGFDEEYEGPADFEEEPDPGDFASEVDYLLAKDRYDYATSQSRADSPVATMEKTPTNTAAFKKWFKDPTGKLSNPDGTPKLLLHGTPRGGFTSFDMGKMRKSESIYLSDSMGAARNYAYRGMGIALDSTVQPREFKPVVLDNWGQAAQFVQADLGMRLELTGGHYALYKDAAAAKPEAIFPNTPAGLDRFNKQYGSLSSQARVENPAYYAVYASLSDPLVFDAQGRSWDHLIYSGKQRRFLSTDDLATYAREAGYDGVIIENIRDGDASLEADEFGYAAEVSHPFNEYMVFNPRQVKSAYNTGTWNRRTSDLRFSFDEESPLAKFMKQLEQEYGEGSAEQMFATMEQLDRARQRAEQRAADADAIAQAAEWTAAAEVEAARQAERDLADQRLSEQRDKANEQAREKAAKARAEKAEAVRSARLAEQMHSGRMWSERLRKQEEQARAKQDRMRQDAQQRLNDLRSRKDQEVEDTKLAERMNAGKRVAEAKRRGAEAVERERERRRQDLKFARSKDAKEAAAVIRKYHKGDVERLSNDPVSTLRQARQKLGAQDRIKAAAENMRTWGREFYKAFINGTVAVDDFSKLQNTDANASVLLRNAVGANSTVQTIMRDHLVGKDGSTIDDQSLEDVVICWKGKGKSRKYDDASQILLQDYMLHRHNIDRMNFRNRARQALEEFEAQHGWLTSLDPREFAELVADDNRTAQRYMELIETYQKAKNKPIFAGNDGKPLSSEYSRSMVEQYEQQYGWLKEKAEGIYEWWDKFMREWVVGESLSLDEYESMRELYPAYVPTYRKDKGGFIAGVNTFGGTVSTKKGVRKATGGTSEVANIEDSYMRLLRQNVMSQRVNAVLRSVTDSAMLDSDGDLAGFTVFDWNDASETFRWDAAANGLEGALEAGTDAVAAKALQRDGNICRVRSWVNGEQVSAIVDPELYEALDFALNSKTGWFTKLGETLSAPMKTAITGANPAFALRNVVRDNLTAQINSVSVVNSISGIKFEKYLAQAVKEMAQNSEHWQQFKALGGTHATYYRNEQGSIVEAVQRRGKSERNPVTKTVGALSWMGENTEAATRFAEYLATIDRLPGGDSYTNRLIGIKNAAEVTVDFSRKGTVGKAFNAWIPYWNPAVQGIDKTFRAFFDQPSVAGKLKVLGRAALTTALPDILLYALYKYLDRDDEWEELNDRTKDTYYCIPLLDEHTFLKIPKSRDWGQLIGTPLMRMLQGLNGREDPFENYFEVSVKPNFLWSNPLDALGISWARELESNKDFAGRAIVPYPYSEMAKGDQWDSDTSRYAKVIADLGNALVDEDWLSPMQIDYIISDYFGDFGSMFQRLFAVGGNDMEAPAEERAKLAAEDLFGGWVADNRYSSDTVNEYYEMLDSVSQELAAERVRDPEGYKESALYKLNSAFSASGSPVDRISNLNAQVRELPDGVEKDELKQQIIDTAREALDMYEAVLSGESTEPKLEMQYSRYGETVRDELISLAGYSEDYSFLPSSYKPSSYTDPKNKKREYVLDDTAKEKYRELYDDQYVSVMEEVIRSSKYRKASDTEKAELLEAARDDVAEQTKDAFMNWLTKNYKSTLKK